MVYVIQTKVKEKAVNQLQHHFKFLADPVKLGILHERHGTRLQI